jgi:hypothetical protein
MKRRAQTSWEKEQYFQMSTEKQFKNLPILEPSIDLILCRKNECVFANDSSRISLPLASSVIYLKNGLGQRRRLARARRSKHAERRWRERTAQYRANGGALFGVQIAIAPRERTGLRLH